MTEDQIDKQNGTIAALNREATRARGRALIFAAYAFAWRVLGGAVTPTGPRFATFQDAEWNGEPAHLDSLGTPGDWRQPTEDEFDAWSDTLATMLLPSESAALSPFLREPGVLDLRLLVLTEGDVDRLDDVNPFDLIGERARTLHFGVHLVSNQDLDAVENVLTEELILAGHLHYVCDGSFWEWGEYEGNRDHPIHLAVTLALPADQDNPEHWRACVEKERNALRAALDQTRCGGQILPIHTVTDGADWSVDATTFIGPHLERVLDRVAA